MDVTKKNFYSLLPSLEKAIIDAEFISIDCELTGLTTGERELEPKAFDSPKEYYSKVYQRALEFLPIQVGLCIFHYDKEGKRYTYEAYNFYTFPFSKTSGFPNKTFQCQPSSLAFLSSCGFDFNKAFGEGIPYLSQPEEEALQRTLEERQQKMARDRDNSETTSDIPIPEDAKKHVQNHIKKIKDFLEDSSDTKEECLVLERLNAFMRRLLYQEVPKELGGDAVHMETGDNFALKVFRGGGEGVKKQREEARMKKEWDDFKEAIGLAHLIKAISKAGKLIIGHNCLLDVLHIVNSFRWPLPSNYDNFKEMVHNIFPRIIDTKIVSLAPQFKDLIQSNVLGHMRATLSEGPFEMPVIEGNVEGRSYSDLIDKSHEGAYDAYITGQCFLSMCAYLAKEEGICFTNLQSIKEIIPRFENRLYLMRLQDVPFMTLGGPDVRPSRNHVFHIIFPREWRQSHIVDLFKPFGPVFISFIDDKSAFVALHRKDQAKNVLRSCTGSKTYTITSFASYQKQCERKSPAQPASPSLDSLRKRKSRDSDAQDSPSIFKKHCNTEQPTSYAKRSIEPIPEEVESDTTGAEQDSSELEETPCKISREFPETDVWG